MEKNAKYYAVRKGFKTGIFNTWAECQMNVIGFRGAEYKSFKALKDAESFMGYGDKIEEASQYEDCIVAYVDGSYDSRNEVYGSGCVIIKDGVVIENMYKAGDNEEIAELWNVSGEMIGSMMAVQYALKNNYKTLHIYYDYKGIECWATGEWKAKKKYTKQYAEWMKDKSKQINIVFHKVKGHSGDKFNDKADVLAKKAVKEFEKILI